MEAKLENILDNMMAAEYVVGAVVADNQGLAFASRGKASASASGLITAIADQAAKLHPNSNAPVVILESADSSVLISKHGDFTGAVYKTKPKK